MLERVKAIKEGAATQRHVVFPRISLWLFGDPRIIRQLAVS